MRYIAFIFASLVGVTANALELLPTEAVHTPSPKHGCSYSPTVDIEFSYRAINEFNSNEQHVVLMMSEIVTVIKDGNKVIKDTGLLGVTARRLEAPEGTIPVTCIKPGTYNVIATIGNAQSNTLEFSVTAPIKEETDEKNNI